MDNVVVVKVWDHVGPSDIAVVIVGVVTFQNFLVESRIQVSQNLPSINRSMHKHGDYETEVDKREHADNTPKSVHVWIEKVDGGWL